MTDTTTSVIEGTAVDGTEIERYQQPPASLFRTDDPVEVVERASKVANALADVIDKRKLFVTVQGKKHILVEGWQLLGSMLGVTAVCVETVPVDGGFKATVEARTADARIVGRADALCTKHERRGPWRSADDYARLSMAQTRATSKALKGPLGFVVSLAGYATTPAEEMSFALPEDDGPQGRRLDESELKALRRVYAETGWSVEQLRMNLTAVGVVDTSDVRAAMRSMTERQAEELLSSMNTTIDQLAHAQEA